MTRGSAWIKSNSAARVIVLAFVTALLVGACGGARVALPAALDTLRLVVVGDAVVQTQTRDPAGRPDVGGLSGAYYDARRHRLYAVSDDRDRPRLVTLDVTVAHGVTLTPLGIVPLQLPHLGRRTLDAEGIAPAPNGHLYVSSEGNAADPLEPVPGIYEYTREGRFVRSLPLPRRYLGSNDGTGMRNNGAFEGLTVSPSGSRLFAATESSLRQDDHEADFEHGAVVRLVVYDLPVRTAGPREYAYRVDPVERPPDFVEPTGENGVAELLALSDTELLVLERAFVRERASGSARSANTIRIYRVRLDDSAEVTGRASLADAPSEAVLKKTLVLDMANVAAELSEPLRALENFEAMTFGPRLPNGSMSILLLSDDNFSERQVTACVVLAFGFDAPVVAPRRR